MVSLRRLYHVLLLGCFLLFQQGCSLTPHEDAKQAQEERACITACQMQETTCLRSCRYSCKACEAREHDKMVKRYKTYLHEQCVQGMRTALQLQSFRDPLQCRKTSCDCPADYRVCVGSCRGNIRKRLQVKPFCC